MRFTYLCIGLTTATITSSVVVGHADAMTILTAKVDKGAVQVKGGKAQPLALITWEGQAVAQASRNGRFRFATVIIPQHCIGELSDGTEIKPVVIQGCGPVGPPGPPGPPGQNCGCGPTPISTPVLGGGSALTVTTLPNSDLDPGWTGISHNSVATHDNVVTTNLDCIGDDCTIDGSNLVGMAVGSPLPLSSGGVSVCVVNSFREAVTGTYNCGTGCSESSVKLLSNVFLVQEAAMPCPPCVGDDTPNDGVKNGTCNGGTTPGAACDVGGISDLFENAGGAPPDAGRTSNDCLPTGSPVGHLGIDLNPLTTGTLSVNANVNCLSGAFPPGSCYCPNQVQPNACLSNTGVGTCPASGVCENGPIDGVCSGQTYRQCRADEGTTDCEDTFPGSGNCIERPRPCFGTNVTRTGTCGAQQADLVSFFCIPATSAAAINTTAGLPGPGALSLPVSRVRFLR
jgi:hypothetical protein